jgi:hypothetical protein
MRSPLKIPHDEFRQVLAKLVEEYICEVRRIRRAGLREAIIHVHQGEGKPVPEGKEMEAYIDLLEPLFDTAQDDPDKVMHLTEHRRNKKTTTVSYSSEKTLKTNCLMMTWNLCI